MRRLKTSYLDKTDKYWLSSYNYTGKEHSEDSCYYSLWPHEKQAETYTSDVLKRGADGCLVVKLQTIFMLLTMIIHLILSLARL